jgi:hypothetical protein
MERTPFLKAFGPLLFGRRARRGLEQIEQANGLEDLYAIFGDLFSPRLWERPQKGQNSRRRQLPPMVTFWAFLSQALNRGSSCAEAVRRVEVWWRWAQWRQNETVTASAYCQARQRLDLATLQLIRQQTAWHLERSVWSQERWGGGRPVKIVDGTMLSMPDTPANQAVWPQPSSQKPGCGFPLLKLVGLFSLSSGALLEEATGDYHQHEATLFRGLWSRLEPGDIVLEDRGFSSYGALATLAARGIDTVARLHQGRKVDRTPGDILGTGDRLVTWQKPVACPRHWTKEEFAALPATLTVRLIEVVVEVPGFRTQSLTLVTTLLDPVVYPAAELRRLYAQRWQVELHFAQIKTTLGLDVLRCHSPAMIRRELQINLIAYNCVRALMQRAAHTHDVPLARLSFQGTLVTLRHWTPLIQASRSCPTKQKEFVRQLLALIAADRVPERPDRSEPRVKKRRPKNFQLLTKPRHLVGNLPHRNRPQKYPKVPLS